MSLGGLPQGAGVSLCLSQHQQQSQVGGTWWVSRDCHGREVRQKELQMWQAAATECHSQRRPPGWHQLTSELPYTTPPDAAARHVTLKMHPDTPGKTYPADHRLGFWLINSCHQLYVAQAGFLLLTWINNYIPIPYKYPISNSYLNQAWISNYIP